MGLIDIIRYYSFLDTDVRCLQGFVFPKKESADVVTVEFVDFAFRYSLEAIARANIKSQLSSVFLSNKAKVMKLDVSDINTTDYYIKLLSHNEMITSKL